MQQSGRAGGAGRRGESRDELVARVVREQEALHPAPVYSERSKRRLRIYLVAVWPIGIALGWVAGLGLGWSLLESLGFGAGLVLALAYIGYVILAERDDGRIQREVRRLREQPDPGGPA